jgi:hypothetical protein
MKELGQRLLAKRTIEGDCWRFSGSHDRCGYGRIALNGRNEPAHRAAWIAWRGDPGEMHVLHSCESRDCFQPSHLTLGTHQENMRQRDTWGHGIRGERVALARLTGTQVVEIRKLRAAGMRWANIAQRFGISAATACHAGIGRTWAHVGGESD